MAAPGERAARMRPRAGVANRAPARHAAVAPFWRRARRGVKRKAARPPPRARIPWVPRRWCRARAPRRRAAGAAAARPKGGRRQGHRR